MMETPSTEYTIVSQIHGNTINPDGTVSAGYTINVRDSRTGVTFPIFLPDERYNADNARTLILLKLDHIRSVHALSE